MTTNQISQNNLINVDTNGNEHYLHLLFNSQVATHIGNCAKEGFTSKNVLILGMLLYINEIKNIPKYLTKESSEYVMANYKSFFTYFYNLIASVPSIFARKQICYQPIEFIDEPKKINFKIKVINEFVNGFINFLKDNKNIDNVSYVISPNKSIQFADMETLLLGETWSDIKIHYNTITIRLSSELELTFENNKLKSFNSIPMGNSFAQSNGTISKELYEKILIRMKGFHRFIHLINDWVIFSYVYEVYYTIKAENWRTFPKFSYGNYLEYHESLVKFNSEHIQTPANAIIWESVIYSIIIQYCPTANVQSSYIELLIILDLLKKTDQFCDSTGKPIRINMNSLFSNDFSELYWLDINLKVPGVIQEWLNKNHPNLQSNSQYKINFSNFGLKFLNATDTSNRVEIKIFNCASSMIGYLGLQGTHWFNSVINIWKQKNPSIKSNYKLETLIDIKQLEQMPIHMLFSSSTSLRYYLVDICKGGLDIPINNQLYGKSNGSSSLSNSTNTTNSSTTNEITFVCEGNTNKITVEEINGEFNSFISDIKKYEFAIGDKNEISICKIKLEKTASKKEIPNPEYQAYLEKKELLENIKLEKSDVLVKELANIPGKTISEVEIKKEVKTQHVNSGYKTFDTMYLRETDEKKLLSVLSKFKTNKELLKSLGLPNKLCVLLDGLPGTGKSSTILTIASYLKKDIYYLSFGDTIESNEDLQMIFDHVVKNCNGGIIVAEDIDAVGTLLHNRNGSTVGTTNVEEPTTQKLSLAYVLNLLQGTITPDNLIFIATTNHIEKLDPAFYRHGRFDARITFKLADHFQLNKIYYKFFNRNIPADLLGLIPENKFTPAQFIFTIKDYISEDFPDKVILGDFLLST